MKIFVLSVVLAVAHLQAQVTWVPHQVPDAPVPPQAIIAGKQYARKLYVCRARMGHGVHSGKSMGSVCIISYKGKAEVFPDFDFATSEHYSWRHGPWDSAVIAGKQFVKYNLYVCRARVAIGSHRYALIPGKAYRTGPHADHCYVPFNGKELDFIDNFDLLYTRSNSH